MHFEDVARAECRVRHSRRAGIRHLREKIQTLREQMRRMEAMRRGAEAAA